MGYLKIWCCNCLLLTLQPSLALPNTTTTLGINMTTMTSTTTSIDTNTMSSTSNSTAMTDGAHVIETSTTATTTHMSNHTTNTSNTTTFSKHAPTSTTSATTTNTTTTTEGVLASNAWASTDNDVTLTEIFLHAVTLSLGLVVVVVREKVPTLLAGNLLFAIFLGVLMKSGQEENPGLSQTTIWPIIVALAGFSLVSGLFYCYQRAMVGVITGLVFVIVGLAITVAAAISPIPWGLVVALMIYIFGHVAAAKSIERPALYRVVTAVVGGSFIANGAQFFKYHKDYTEEIANAVVRAMNNPEEGVQSVADDVRPQVAVGLCISVLLFCTQYVVPPLWLKYKAKGRNKNNMTNRANTRDDKAEEGHSLAETAV